MAAQPTAHDLRPWYREPWPWIIIGLVGSAVIASLITLWIAIANPDHLVIDDTEYQRIKSEMRAQTTAEEEDARAEPRSDDG